MNKKEINVISAKLFLLLLFIIFFILAYCFTIPKASSYSYKAYTFHFFYLFDIFIMCICLFLLKIECLKKDDIWISVSIFTLSLSINIPITFLSVLNGLCAVITYLTAKYIYAHSNCRILIVKERRIRAIAKSILMGIIIACILFIIEKGFFFSLKQSTQIIPIIFNAIAAAVSEEIIFRYFLFAIIVKAYNGEVKNMLIAYLFLIIPFSALHLIDGIILGGFLSVIPALISMVLISAIHSIIACKRDLLTAISMHFTIDFILALLVK